MRVDCPITSQVHYAVCLRDKTGGNVIAAPSTEGLGRTSPQIYTHQDEAEVAAYKLKNYHMYRGSPLYVSEVSVQFGLQLLEVKLGDKFSEITLQQALHLAAQQDERHFVRYEEKERMLVAVYSDGLEIGWQSEHEDCSTEYTPMNDWNPPTVWARIVRKSE